MSVFSARFDDTLESSATLLDAEARFPIGTTDAALTVEAPRALEVVVADEATGAAIGPATFHFGRKLFAEAPGGRVALLEPPATFQVRVPGYGRRTVIVGSQARELRIELERACSLSVSAAAPVTGGREPSVELVVLSCKSGEILERKLALGSLEWSSDDLTAEDYLLSATAGQRVASTFVTLRPGEPLHVALAVDRNAPTAPIVARLAGDDSDAQLLDTPLVLKSLHRSPGDRTLDFQNVDAAREATFGPYPTGLYEVRVCGSATAQRIRHVAEDGRTGVEVPVPPLDDLTLRVVDARTGEPLSGIRVRLEPAEAQVPPVVVNHGHSLELARKRASLATGSVVPAEVSDTEGRIRVRLRRLRYTARVSDVDGQPYWGSATLDPAENKEHTLQLRSVDTIRGSLPTRH